MLLGLPPQIAASLAGEPQGFKVWPENMPIVEAWLAIATQWRTVALADGRVLWLGLDYASVKVGLDAERHALSGQQWAGLRVMERSAGTALNGTRG